MLSKPVCRDSAVIFRFPSGCPGFATGFPPAGWYHGQQTEKGGEAVTVVYVDSVFILNGLMDYFLLLATAHLAGVPPRRGRYVLAALLGGVYAVSVFLPGLSWLASPVMKLAAGTAMALTAYGDQEKFLRMTLLLFLVSCGFAGCVLGFGLVSGGVPMENGIFYTDVDARVLLLAAGAAYAVLTVVFRASARHGVRGELVPVTLHWEDRQARLTALRDTGNELRDPVTGRPVLVVQASLLEPLWPPDLGRRLSGDALLSPAETLTRLGPYQARFRLTPYTAVGVAGGLLLTARTDWGSVGGRRYDRLLVALSPTALGEGFGALWGEAERSVKYESFAEMDTEIAGASAAKSGGPLHRGQRHAAGAAVQRAGGRVGGADRGAGRPAGADRT